MRDDGEPTTETGAGSGSAAPSFSDALKEWARIGLLSFGGPTAQIALMHRVVVDERKWLTESQFLNALSFCMLLPGPEAMQLATYAGWRLHGVAGGLAAGLLFVVPGALVVLGLALVYALYGNVPVIAAIFFGIKAAVLVIVLEALLRISRRALGSPAHWAIAAASFVGIFALGLPFPVIILAAAAAGLLLAKGAGEAESVAAPAVAPARTVATIGIWLAVWTLPLALLAAVFGRDHVLAQLFVFFSKLAVVSFGGAYAVLAYMTDTVVKTHGWLQAGQMLDGLGLAETTPGPLILVTEFVGFLAAFRWGGGDPVLMGVLGALVALWATFAPCFLWIFAGAPYIERLHAQPRLRGALSGITAAVVGVILNLAVWFGMHVFFRDVARVEAGPFRFIVPDPATLDWRVVVLALVTGVLLLRLKWGIAAVLGVAAALALAIRQLGL
ncbi:MAG: chromate efflux transporter [Hyphomicrobiaceae bacterium]